MTTHRLLLLIGIIAGCAAVIAFFNPFTDQVEADVTSLSVAVEQFLGVVLAIVGALIVVVSRLGNDPHKNKLIAIGVLMALIGIVLLFKPIFGLKIVALLLAIKLLISGVLKLNIARQQWPGNLAYSIAGAGVVSLLVSVLVFLHFAAISTFELGTLIAIDLLGTGVMMAALAMRGKNATS